MIGFIFCGRYYVCTDKKNKWMRNARLYTFSGRHTASSPSGAGNYKKYTSHYCTTTIRSYSTLYQAKATCDRDYACKAVYDSSCDNRGTFSTCKSAIGSRSNSGSCMYQKPGSINPTQSSCKDQYTTGFSLSGRKASCSQLKGYCNHGSYGAKIKKVCCATCGGSSGSSLSGEWPKVWNHYCSSTIRSTYSSAAAAQRACLTDYRCKAISDSNCDGRGNWATCRSATGSSSSQGSCMYTKSGH